MFGNPDFGIPRTGSFIPLKTVRSLRGPLSALYVARGDLSAWWTPSRSGVGAGSI